MVETWRTGSGVMESFASFPYGLLIFSKPDSSNLGISLTLLPLNRTWFTKLDESWTKVSTFPWSWSRVSGPSLLHMVLPLPPLLPSSLLILNSFSSSWPLQRSKAASFVLHEELMYSDAWHSLIQFQCFTLECQVLQVISLYKYCELLSPTIITS